MNLFYEFYSTLNPSPNWLGLLVPIVSFLWKWYRKKSNSDFMQITRIGETIKIRGHIKASKDLLNKEIKDLFI